jgi:hypothetical protein
MSVNYIQVLVAKVASLEKQLKQLQMAFNDLAANQMVAYNQASSGGFTLKSGQTNPNTLQMIKDMAFAMYNLSPTTGSNDILGNQLMQKKFWLVAKYTISRKSYCRK